jgi:hypothetical protein
LSRPGACRLPATKPPRGTRLGNEDGAIGPRREVAVEAREKAGRHMSQSSGREMGAVKGFDLLERASVPAAVEAGDLGLAERVWPRLFQPSP